MTKLENAFLSTFLLHTLYSPLPICKVLADVLKTDKIVVFDGAITIDIDGEVRVFMCDITNGYITKITEV